MEANKPGSILVGEEVCSEEEEARGAVVVVVVVLPEERDDDEKEEGIVSEGIDVITEAEPCADVEDLEGVERDFESVEEEQVERDDVREMIATGFNAGADEEFDVSLRSELEREVAINLEEAELIEEEDEGGATDRDTDGRCSR